MKSSGAICGHTNLFRSAEIENTIMLEAATKNPSMYLGTLDKVGTIEKGKLADLVLLEANPLDNKKMFLKILS